MSKFSINDPVSFINEKQDGIIKALKPNGIYVVEIEDGFEIEVQEKELVLIRKATTSILAEKPTTQKEETFIPDFIKNIPALTTGIWLVTCPSNAGMTLTGPADYYIVNNSAYDILYAVSSRSSKKHIGISSGKIISFDQVYIKTLNREDVNGKDDWFIQLIFHNVGEFEMQATTTRQFPLAFPDLVTVHSNLNAPYAFCKLEKITDSYSMNDLDTEDLFHNFTAKDLENKLNRGSASEQEKTKQKSNQFSSLLEVDLHIEKLYPDFQKLSNTEIITIQLDHFTKKLDEAIYKNFYKIIFIHGAGNGRLKTAVRQSLDHHQLKYNDGNYAQYGGGATEVTLS